MVVHYYAQLYLTGFLRKPFRALLLDTDDFSPSLAYLSEFFRDVAAGFGAAAEREVPSIELRKLSPRNKVGLVSDILAAKEIPAQPGFHHAVQAFFSKDDLKENVTQGLYARPALSAVLAFDESLNFLDKIETGSVVTLVGSCTGGTGGGLSIPVLWRLETRPGANLQTRAALMGDFFTSSSPQDSVDDQANRFRSNRLLFLKAMEETVGQLQLYKFIEEPRMIRDKSAEKNTRLMAWPDRNGPYWQGVSAVDALLTETVSDAGGKSLDVPPLEFDRAEAALRNALGRVDSFLRHSVLDRVREEAFVESQWGANLPAAIRSFGKFASNGISSFAGDVQREMQNSWKPLAANGYGLAHVFPDLKDLKSDMNSIIRCGWPMAPSDLGGDALGGPEAMKRRVARLLLFTLLSRGGAK